MVGLNELISAAAIEQHVAAGDVDLLDEEAREVLVRQGLTTKSILCSMTYAELLQAQLRAAPAKAVKLLFPGGTDTMTTIANDVADIKRLFTPPSQETRRASAITDQDLDEMEKSLNIVFVPSPQHKMSPQMEAALADATEYDLVANKPEATSLAQVQNQVQLPPHLMWSNRTDTDELKASMAAGGASLPFSIGCRTDAMVVVRRAKLNLEGAITATVELKQKVVRQSLRQAKLTYVCASLKSQLPVISCVTDLENTAAAYYTTGQTRDGATVIVEHIFSSPAEMLQFLTTALSAVPANVMDWRDATRTEIEIPEALPNPKRIRLPVPRPTQRDNVVPMLAQLLGTRDDVEEKASGASLSYIG